jgi:hypothetical protein
MLLAEVLNDLVEESLKILPINLQFSEFRIARGVDAILCGAQFCGDRAAMTAELPTATARRLNEACAALHGADTTPRYRMT